MGFSAMDGFFLSVFLAVCIVMAVLLRYICVRYCLLRCKDKTRTGHDGTTILQVTATPSIMPARRAHHLGRTTVVEIPEERLRRVAPEPDSTVFTIYTFPQQGSPEIIRPLSSSERYYRVRSQSPEPPKYSPEDDLPPSYDDLFPSRSPTTNNSNGLRETSPSPNTPLNSNS